MLASICRWVIPPLVVVLGLVAFRLFVTATAELPSRGVLRAAAEPNLIAPRYDEPRVITDEQLRGVLDRVKPPMRPLKTNNLVHALRLWGRSADFGDPQIPTGREMLDYFLDDRTFRRLAGNNVPPLFYRDRDGLAVRSYDDALTNRDTSSYHADDLLATLAECRVPLATPMQLREGEATVGQLLHDSLARFNLDRFEYEWALIAYARYVFPEREFRNQWGERIRVDDLVAEAIGPPMGLGPCNGLHRLEGLVVLLRADEQHRALRPKTRAAILEHLREASQLLGASQTADGYWTRRWPEGAPAAESAAASQASLHDKLLVTGHHLEWLALAPEEVQPPRETIVRAGQWLTRTLLELDQKTLEEAYGPYTHAARALALWRSKDPYEAWMTPQPIASILRPSPSPQP
jgi:hypothetical protein